ncbi:MAG: MBL fold metallo-hydrolase [Gemmatimonadetes bacterium]|nr:MBL fold metallo-hydrolase [Gemmatimonadota bacterium]MBP6669930.1 MBL fold metallo-hydrolase [Gemmatimonadales bacterium]MBK6778651.1 MBL fold metallo-hydrolase [Gemmatimonadota bacterium]MBK7349040.1 MBL fold metallo-hydrolase [Gemmatimonadota bacterium]MBK7714602.1 MBL fold metallo-hydrolase [Gemmatimonadota bacterium]
MAYTVTFWGTRGSIPTPGVHTARYGGNTSCVAVTGARDQLVILDAGSGIRLLGRELMRVASMPMNLDILLSHTHWDHIQGLPFFQPLNTRGNSVRIYGAAQAGVPLEEILDRQMDPVVFPVPLKALAADLRITEISGGRFEIDGFLVEAFRLRHPGTTLGYKLVPARGGRTIAYLTDNELGLGGSYDVPPDWRRELVRFLGGVDTLIHDGMYSEAMIESRAGWGHSTPEQAVDLAAEAGVRRLVLFHHEPEHDDGAVDALVIGARSYAAARAPGLQLEAAMEGMSLTL